jgi:SAM-dependent methyltransferase
LSGWLNLDVVPGDGVDIIHDLDTCAAHPLPLEPDSIEEFLGSHLLEHIRHPLPLMQELHRVARPGARAVFRLPYGSSDDAFEDQTHVRPYFLHSFGYFSQPFYWRADYGYRGDWQTQRLVLKVRKARYQGRTPEQIWHDVMSLRNVVLEMSAELTAVKPIRPPRRELQAEPPVEFALV